MKTIRYNVTTAVNGVGISAQDLALILSLATSAAAATSLIGSIRLVKIRAWSPCTIGAQVAIEFHQTSTTFIGSPSILHSDICVSMALPARISCAPPENSLSGFWISGAATSTAAVIDVTGSVGSIFDFTFEVVMTGDSDNVVGQAWTPTGTALLGTVYERILCGGNLNPVAFNGLLP